MHWKYLKYVLRHKWFVLRAGLKLRVPLWQLVVHDWSKFAPSEWFPYVRRFYGSCQTEGDDFLRAWLYHQHRNPHHWQYWLLRTDENNGWAVMAHQPEFGPWTLGHCGVAKLITGEDIDKFDNSESLKQMSEIVRLLNGRASPLKIPENYVREMIADWIGAGQAQGKDDVEGWYAANRDKMILHADSRELVERLIKEYSKWK